MCPRCEGNLPCRRKPGPMTKSRSIVKVSSVAPGGVSGMGGTSSSQDPSTAASGRVFISYRRGDTNGEAHAIRERLRQRYGSDQIFMDADSIPLGRSFDEWINSELDSTALMLVLIGRRWMGRGKTRRICSPEDWVGREISVALDRDIPIIPILIEGAPLPSSSDLPEQLQPLITKQAMALDNSSFEFDMRRLEDAVTTYFPPAAQDAKTGRLRGKSGRRVLYTGAGTVLMAALVAAILLLTLPSQSGESKTAQSVSASSAVLRIPSPELLAENLLVKGFIANLPPGVSPNPARLPDTPNGLAVSGIVATIQIPLNEPANHITVFYYVFQNQGDASSYYYTAHPYPSGYKPTGYLTPGNIRDQTKCEVARQSGKSTSSSSGCLSLSGTVVSFSVVVQGGSGSAGAGPESALATGTVRNLQQVAAATSQQPLADPPAMTSQIAVTGSDLYASLARDFPTTLMPDMLTSPSVSEESQKIFGLVNGLVENKYIYVGFNGPDYLDFEVFYVFSNPEQASSWFAVLDPEDPTGVYDRPTGTHIPSGFSSSQQARCGTWSQRAVPGWPALGVSECFVQWGDVVIVGGSKTKSSLSHGNADLALTLARSGLLRIAQVIAL